jgi:hypothetical protein
MGGRSWVLAAAACAAALGCDTKPIGPARGSGAGGQSAPVKELNAASHSGPSNPLPAIDPTGSFQVYKGAKHDLQCIENLRGIAAGLQMYITRTGDYPAPGAFFRSMLESGDINDFHICAIPRSNPTKDEIVAQMGEKAYRVTMDKLNDATSSAKPIVWDPIPFQDGRHYLTLGNTVEIVAEDQFQALMAKWEGK